MTVKSLGNLAVLRTFRVLRALKTVAVVPGKTVAEAARIVFMGVVKGGSWGYKPPIGEKNFFVQTRNFYIIRRYVTMS